MMLLSTLWAQAQVTANFSGTPLSGCTPLVVQFTDLSTGPVTSWFWNFGNGNTSTLQNPAAVYVTPGTYTVTLTVSDGVGNNTLTQTNLITVFQDPTANFTNATPRSGCAPLTVCFSDLSTPGDGAINQWLWDFGDGNTATGQNPCHTYSAPGTYTVSLVATDVNGCNSSLVQTNYVSVSNPPIAAFIGSPLSACVPPLTVNFTNNSSGGAAPLSAQWDFGDGASSTLTNPSHTYTATGSYTVTLITTDVNGCADTATLVNYVNIDNPVANFTPSTTSICEGQSVTFTNTSAPPGGTYTWNFGDGGTSTATNPSHTYATAGTYTVTLIASNGTCADTLVQTALITVDPAPVANLVGTPTNGCAVPHTVNFTDLSTGNPTTWLWNFGDGNTSNQQNPSHTYTAPGTYTVTLTVTSANGCTDVVTFTNYIQVVPPVANFVATPLLGCVPLNVAFTDLSTSVEPIVSWQWDFGDGNTGTGQNPGHTYTATGVYTVTLIIVNAAGCTDTLVRPAYITVGDVPIACFSNTPDSACVNDPIQFTDCSTNATGWFWDFGDGGTSTQQNPGYAYQDTGCFTVTLVVSNFGCTDDTVITNAVCIAPPAARFTLNPAIGCAVPHLVTFTDQSILPHTWLWNFGDGNTSTIQNPTHTYGTPGNYTVTLTVTDTVSGCSDDEVAPVSISIATAAFTSSVGLGCGPLVVNFTDLSTSIAGITTWAWNFGDGGTSNQQNPSHTYQNPGTYTVTLTVTDGNGCTDVEVQASVITVIGPTVDFVADTLVGCDSLFVSFTDLSVPTAPITAWSWNFGDGSPVSTLQNPTHTYFATGNYTVSLTVTDADGCVRTRTRNQYIRVSAPLAAFTLDDTLTCAGVNINFANGSTGAGNNYVWDFGDGNTSTATNPNHSYATNGTYTVTLSLTDVNGCRDTAVQVGVLDIQDVLADFGANPTNASCPPLLVAFSDSSVYNIVSWQWNFGDNTGSTLQNPSHVYTIPGSYDVTLSVINDDGCRDTLFVPGLINILGPFGNFGFNPDTGCTPQLVNFGATATNTVLYTWDFGDGTVGISTTDSIDHVYTQTGTFFPILILDDGNGCTYSIISPDSIVIDTIPFPDFAVNANILCGLDTVRFTDLTISTRPITDWFWDFGDGSTSTLQNPSHFYAAPGQYTVTLGVVNTLGCTDTIQLPANISIYLPPTAAFTPSDTLFCAPGTVTFTDNSSGPQSIVAWNWDFGDGGTSTQQNPSHTFLNPGTYLVTLIAIDSGGCRDTVVRSILGNPGPTALFTADDTTGCPPHPVIFTATTGFGITTFFWDFGDGSQAAIGNPAAHTYLQAGNYDVTLIVTDTLGCTDTLVRPQYIAINPPVADFTPDITSGCPALTVTFSDASTATNTIVAWDWDFGDGNTGTGAPVSHTYTTPGTYTVTLIVTDSIGCRDTVVKTNLITVFTPPTSLFGITDTLACIPFTLQFTDSSSGNGAPIVAWNWSFGDGGLSTQQNPIYAYAIPGPYTITLIVTDGNGCRDTSSILFVKPPDPVANFTASTTVGCPPLSTIFTADTTGGMVLFTWDFGDGSPLAQGNPVSHTYTSSGNYSVTLIATNIYGCSDTLTRPNYIQINPPLADFSQNLTSGCPPLTVTFTDLSTGTNTIVAWDWDFGDGNTGSGTPVTHTYLSPGVYDVTLIITDNVGCRDTIVKPNLITVFTPPTANFGITDTTACFPFTIELTDSSIGNSAAIVFWLWNFGDGNTSTLQNPTHAYATPGPYNISLIVTDANGCQDTANTLFVRPLDPVANFTASDTVGCPPLPTIFTADTTGGMVLFTWDFGDGSPVVSGNPVNHTYTTSGNFTVTLIATNSAGCSDTLTRPAYIQINPPLADFTQNLTSGCPPLTVTFSDASTTSNNIVAWDWDFGDGSTGTGAPVTHTYGTPGVYDVTLIVTDSVGCRDTIVKPNLITVFAPPTALFGIADTIACLPFTIEMADSSTGNPAAIAGWAWDFGDGGTSNLQNPTHAYAAPGPYLITLIVTDANGCQDTATFPFVVPVPPVAAFTASDTVGCPPLPTVFTATNPGGLVLFQWDFGDGSAPVTGNPVSHTYTAAGNYTVTLIVTDANGCQDTLTRPSYIRINPPVADFTQSNTSGCPPLSVTFNDASTSSNNIVAWDWDFGDGTTGTGAPVTHTYGTPGVYTVTLIVTDSVGCRDTIVKPNLITVFTPPTALFGISDTLACSPFTIQLSDSSSGTAAIVGWAWDFGDGGTSNQQNPTHGYTVPGPYTITLIATDANGCQDTFSLPFTAPVRPLANFVASDSAGCSPLPVIFTADSVNVVSYQWNFGDGGTANTGPIVSHLYANSGTYSVTLIIEDIFGCFDTLVRPNYIYVDTIDAAFTQTLNLGCPPLVVNFTDQSFSDTTIVSWLWNFGDGSTSNFTNPSHTYLTAGTYTVFLTVTNALGCTDTVSGPVIQVFDALPPAVPPILMVTVESNTNDSLSWLAYRGPDFSHYVVYREDPTGSNNWLAIDSIFNALDTTYRDLGLNNLQVSYCYKLQVVDLCGLRSSLDSSRKHCTIELQASPGIDIATLVWNPYIGWDSVMRYDVYRVSNYDTALVQFVGSVPGGVTMYVDSSVVCYEDYCYRVRAWELGGYGEVSWSDTSCALPIHIPNNFPMHICAATVVSDTFVELQWDAPLTPRPQMIFIEKSDDGQNWVQIATLPPTALTYTDTDVNVHEQSYYYRISLLDSCGDIGPWSNLGRTIFLEGENRTLPFLEWNPYEEWAGGVRSYDLEVFNELTQAWQPVTSIAGVSNAYEDNLTFLDQPFYCYRLYGNENGGSCRSLSNETCVPVGPRLFAPNAFSPNGDGLNDLFELKGIYIADYHFMLFDRWGALIYESFSLDDHWNGTWRKKPCQEGVYVWRVDARGFDGTVIDMRGTCTLIR
jgi:gliding motility-associated-like protein